MKFGHIIKRNSDLFPLLESLSENWERGKELEALRLYSKVFHGTRGSFVVSVIEMADCFINNGTRSSALHGASIHRFGEQLLKTLYHLDFYFKKSVETKHSRFCE